MPKPQLTERYLCDVCNKSHKSMESALDCEGSHDTVIIKIMRSDLAALNAFLVSGNPVYVTATLSKTVRKYHKLRGDVE